MSVSRLYRLVSRSVIVALGFLGLCGPVAASQLPSGFQETTYVPGVNDPRAFAFLPDGRIVVACGHGNVYIGDGATVTLVGNVPTSTDGERGLNGLAIDPDFSLNGFIWVYYTALDPAHNRVSRFTLANGELGDEVIMLEGPPVQAAVHNGGCLRFAADGTLFVSMGDDAQFSATAQDPRDLRGKVLHINRDGTPAIGNPYLSGEGDPRVWALGFRNPFRFNIQPGAPGSSNLFIGDVGADSFEEVDVGIPGGNFGWASVEGPSPAGLPGLVYPIYAYAHAGQGASIIGGDHARPGDFAPEYLGDYFFGDWVRNVIYRMRLDATNRPVSVETWATGIPGPVDIQFGPDGSLYYAAQSGSAVRRIAYVGGTNRQPVAIGTASPDSGPAPLTTVLDGTASYDPEGDPLTASWSTGDQGVDLEGIAVSHQYAAGVYYARLTVHDPDGGSNATPPIRIVAGNNRPIAKIAEPLAGARYNAGEVIGYSGTNGDAEEGSLPCSRNTWSVSLHHDQHVHPFLGPVQGACGGSFVIADRGETSADTWYEIAMSVADTGAPLGPDAALTGGSSVSIYPNTATMSFKTAPLTNLTLQLDTQSYESPRSVTGVVNFRRTIGAPTQERPDGHTWSWLSWSDGGDKDHEISTPAVDTTYTATFGCDVLVPVTGLTLKKKANDWIVLSWDPVDDSCLQPSPRRYRVYASSTRYPESAPGSFPEDPNYVLIGETGFESFNYLSPPGYWNFVVVPVGTDQHDGPVEHFGN